MVDHHKAARRLPATAPGPIGDRAFAAPDTPQLPIVFASGHSDTTAIEAATEPATTLLRKPFRIDDLQAVLANALARAG